MSQNLSSVAFVIGALWVKLILGYGLGRYPSTKIIAATGRDRRNQQCARQNNFLPQLISSFQSPIIRFRCGVPLSDLLFIACGGEIIDGGPIKDKTEPFSLPLF